MIRPAGKYLLKSVDAYILQKLALAKYVSILLRSSFLFLIRSYQFFISPLLGANCRFLPTCSDYALQAIRSYGIGKGGILAARRISKCHPWGKHGFDPVPPVKPVSHKISDTL